MVKTEFNRWEADEECKGPFPIVQSSVEKTLMNYRNEKFRKAPTHCSEIESVLEDELMSSTFCHSFHRERHRLYDTTFSSDEFGYCIFSSKKSIQLILNAQKNEEERFLVMDATFSITPNRMFYQVLIIYARYFEKVNDFYNIFFEIAHSNGIFSYFSFSQTYPLVYVLMTKKTQKAYEHALKYVHENIFPLQCGAIITDFECAMRNAIRHVVPGVKLLGCWFHYAQAIRRKVASIEELFLIVRTKEDARNIY